MPVPVERSARRSASSGSPARPSTSFGSLRRNRVGSTNPKPHVIAIPERSPLTGNIVRVREERYATEAEAQAALAYLLIKNRISVTVTIGPSFNALLDLIRRNFERFGFNVQRADTRRVHQLQVTVTPELADVIKIPDLPNAQLFDRQPDGILRYQFQLQNAIDEWPNGGMAFPKQDIRNPEDFAAMARLVRPEDFKNRVLISADLDEIFELSDRILVMSGGRIVHETPAATARAVASAQASITPAKVRS